MREQYCETGNDDHGGAMPCARGCSRAPLIHGAKDSADERASAVQTLDAVHPAEERLIEPLRFLERRKMPAPLKKDVGVPG